MTTRVRAARLARLAILAVLAAPVAAAAQRGAEKGGLQLPESALRVLLRYRDYLELDGGQALTLDLKDTELQLRIRRVVENLGSPGDRGAAPGRPGDGMAGGGAMPGRGMGGGPAGGPGGGGNDGPPSGPDGGSAGAGGPRPAVVRAGGDVVADRLRTEVEALDQAAVASVRSIFRPDQLAKVDALLARRAALLSRSGTGQPDPPLPRGIAPGEGGLR